MASEMYVLGDGAVGVKKRNLVLLSADDHSAAISGTRLASQRAVRSGATSRERNRA